ncbi:MAG: sugar phosphate isomerase/epimerase [Acidobacteria bacterium]|nr:sugar phosphate isomerase/epimerase [Acidobacteriota bacterium]
MITRREVLAALAAAPAAVAAHPRYQLGVTTNTRGGWENDTWLAFREAKAAGFDHVETFIHYFKEAWDKNEPALLQPRIDEIGVKFVTISNGAPMEMHFDDPSKQSKIVEEHVKLAKFVKALGCTHLKCNAGPPRLMGNTGEDLRQMVKVYDELGARLNDVGMVFAPHAHMWSQFETRREVEYILEHTNPKLVRFVLDTGHITMAGMDPVALARTLGHRIVEFHLKDVHARYRGGARVRIDRNDSLKDPIFFALGTSGGVDFPGLADQLATIGWSGWLTCELDSSPMRPPLEGAKINRAYMREKFGV